MKKLSDYLTRAQLARTLGVHVNTLLRWEQAGKIVPYRNPMNNYRLYDLEEVKSLIKIEKENPQT